jgi:hypothetical protein
MPDGVIEALSADRDAVLAICDRLAEPEWDARSGCPGWSVKDAFIRWITHRARWEDVGGQASGDEPLLATVRELRVF